MASCFGKGLEFQGNLLLAKAQHFSPFIKLYPTAIDSIS